MLPRIIGLNGPSRAGKDETASILVRHFDYEQRAQAASIRDILLGLNPLIKDDNGELWTMRGLFEYYNENWDEVKAVSRESTDYMIRLGQTARDVIGVNIWLNTAFPPIGSLKKVVVSDIRQLNEFEAVKARGGEVWKINRPGVELRGMDGLLDHLEFDEYIDNDGTLEQLEAQVLDRMKGKL